MYRFVALAWRNPHEDRTKEVHRHIAGVAARDGQAWSLAYRTRGLEVWHAGDRAGHMECVGLPDGGVLLGRVLDRAEGFPDWDPRSLAEAASSLDPAQKATWLFANAWGSYVGFLPPGDAHPPAVLRDPSGGLPCYHIRWRDFDVFMSNVENVRGLPDTTFSIDLDSLITHALMPLACKADTGLNEVDAVLPGECRTIADAPTRGFPWNPVMIARDALQVDTAGAAERMRHTLLDVVAALARPHRRILHTLGGLDSSIVLSGLTTARGPADITCVNFYTSSFGGDERRYARTMATHAGVPLVEQRLEPERIDLDIWRMQEMGPSPPAGFDSLTLAGDFLRLAEEQKADVLSYGTGGDSVFFQAPYIFPALDHVAARGFGGRWAGIALEAAQYGGRSLASTLVALLRERLRPRRCFETIVTLVAPEIIEPYIDYARPADWASPARLHPTLAVDDGFPKGKYFQILASAFFDLESQRYRFPPHHGQDYICPLVAQPFLELCLRIPTWQLADGGISRGLARRAFWQDLPRAISGRTSKSTSEGVYDQIFARNLPILRETLLDGVLAGKGFFNRKRLETALNRQHDQLAATDVALLFDFYAWEIWAQRWMN